VAYSTDGIVVYTPTQGETNYTSFVLIAKKTGCIPANVTVLTSASSTAGYAGTDQSKIANATSTVNLSGTTISTSQAVQSVTNRVTSNVDQWNGSTATGMPMPTYTQPTGFLAATFPGTVASPTNITQASGVTLAAVTHTGAVIPLVTDVTTKSGYSLSQAFPTNFASMSIDTSGRVLLQPTQAGVTIPTVTDLTTKTGFTAAVSDKTGFSLLQTTGLGNQTANITGSLSGTVGGISGVTFPANFGSMVINAGTGHTAAVVHSVQSGAYTSAAFAANWLTAAGLAADAVAKNADGVWDEATSGHTTAGTTGKALIDSGAAGNPWSTDIATGYTGTQAGNVLNQVKVKTDTIQSGGTVYVTSPVTATGQLASPLIIGDDYLAANGRRFRWTVALPSGFVIATSTARFGMRYEDDEGVNSFIASGTVTDATGGNVYLDFDVAKTVTGTLRPGWYEWSVEIVSATGVEITRVKSGKNVEWQGKQT
jgi:hypothetical protein